VSDGLRWHEIFTGADPLLLNEKNGGNWVPEERLKKKYWRAAPAQRRRILFPFIWGTFAAKGQIFGNQAKAALPGSPTASRFPIPVTTR
jgi:hypothetical protein